MDDVRDEELRRHRVQVLFIFLPMAFALLVLVVAVIRALG